MWLFCGPRAKTSSRRWIFRSLTVNWGWEGWKHLIDVSKVHGFKFNSSCIITYYRCILYTYITWSLNTSELKKIIYVYKTLCTVLMCNVWRRFPIVPSAVLPFICAFLSVVKLSLNQRQDKSDVTSDIPLYYHVLSHHFTPDINPRGCPPSFMNHPLQTLVGCQAIKVAIPKRQDSEVERCENGGVLWFRWYPMASRSSHRGGRLFWDPKCGRTWVGFHVTTHTTTPIVADLGMRFKKSLQLRAAREWIFFACIFGKCESGTGRFYWQQNLIVTTILLCP